MDPKNYSKDPMKIRQVKDVLNKVKRQIRLNGKQHSATMHYITNYGYIPLWILVKVLSFGILSELYSILDDSDKNDIANFYNLDTETLAIYLTILSNYGNLCAHEDILYDHRTQKIIPDSKYHAYLNIEKKDDEYIYGKNDLFALIIIMKQMLSKEEFDDMLYQIGYEVDMLDGKVDTVSLKVILNKMGFPDNFRDIKNID